MPRIVTLVMIVAHPHFPVPDLAQLHLALLDHCPSLIFVKNCEGRYLEANLAFQRFCRRDKHEIIGRTDADLFTPEQAARFVANDQRVLLAGHPMEFEEIAEHEDGPHTSIVYKFPLRRDGTIYAIGGITTDITDRKLAEDTIKQMRLALEHALDERERIANDLHDQIIQSLYATGLELETCRVKVRAHPGDVEQTLVETIARLNHVIDVLRGWITSHPPAPPSEQEFHTALHRIIHPLATSTGLSVLFNIDPNALARLTPNAMHHVLAIIQEALVNSVRHGEAHNADIKLQVHAHTVILSIRDDGRGFNPMKPPRQGHGLRNIYSRARRIGGKIRFHVGKTRGTHLELVLHHQD